MGVGRIDTPQARQIVQTVAAQLIIGYAPPHMVAADDRRRAAQLRRIFGDDTHPEPSIIIGASDDRGMMLGGAVVEPFVSDELISKEPDAARQFATTHRILAALFVLPEARGSGIGRELLSEAAYWALPHGGRYLDGFVDDRNNSADFYRRSGATVVGHNTGLPARRPTNSELSHYPGIDGTWFYVDAWRMHQGKINCSRCRDVFEFVDEELHPGGEVLTAVELDPPDVDIASGHVSLQLAPIEVEPFGDDEDDEEAQRHPDGAEPGGASGEATGGVHGRPRFLRRGPDVRLA